MTIGLNADELMSIFFQSFQIRTDLFQSRIEGAEVGENPKVKEIIDKSIENMRKIFPNISNPEFLAGLSSIFGIVLYTLMDTIAANNSELEKSIPHI